MIVEVLCEDKSSIAVLENLIPEILEDFPEIVGEIFIYPHRGKGKLPYDISEKPKSFASALLDLLPAKLRAYEQVYQDDEIILVIVLDADDNQESEIYQEIEHVLGSEFPDKYFVIGIAVEEMEAWLLGDYQALSKAYPKLDYSILKSYQQDSVCGTWEILAKAILGKQASDLIKVGYPAVGIYKNIWAKEISPYMRIDNNHSPSYQKFVKCFRTLLAKLEEDKCG